MCAVTEYILCPAKPSDFAEVRALVVEGLAQRWRQYEPSFNPDLESFAASYGSALVLVAKSEGRIVGCGILIHETEHIARVVRMSVSVKLQRKGIGSTILKALLERAPSMGYKEVVLETTASWVSAIAFYKRHGFLATVEQNGDQYFRFLLAET